MLCSQERRHVGVVELSWVFAPLEGRTVGFASVSARRLALGLLAALLLATAGPLGLSAYAQSGSGQSGSGQPEAEPSDGEAAAPIAYAVVFEGLEEADAELEERMRAQSLAIELSGDPPRTPAGLRRRAERDVERFGQVLRGAGHYDGTVAFAIEEGRPDAAEGARRIVYEVTPGPLYLIEAVELAIGPEAEMTPAPDDVLADIGLDMGRPAAAEPIIAAEGRLARRYRMEGRPFAEVAERRTVIDRSAQTMTVRYRVAPGPAGTFGDVEVEGADKVERSFIAQYAAWTPGQRYDIRLVEETQRRLAGTGLFDSVTVTPRRPEAAAEDAGEGAPDEGGTRRIPVRIEVVERAHRTLGFGASYSTSVGPGVSAFWEHRNLFNEGERLRTTLSASPIERGGEANFRKPYFLRDRQALLAEGEVKDVTSDAFDELRASAFVGVERQLTDVWTATVGPTLDLIDQKTDDTGQDTIALLGLRGNLRRDSTDDPLNPTDGSRLDLSLVPYAGIAGEADQFVSSQISGSRYLKIDEDARFVLAGRARLGAILGAERTAIPAGKRFYAGGGGSVRGYGFQRLGPLDGDLDPIGGRSVMEVGLELRTRITETIGLVPFIEGGNVYPEEIPPVQELDLRWGAGLGLRYFTDIGPVRLDVAIPINQRENIDDAYQIYVSLGQAF